jgi:hypothetical protein
MFNPRDGVAMHRTWSGCSYREVSVQDSLMGLDLLQSSQCMTKV